MATLPTPTNKYYFEKLKESDKEELLDFLMDSFRLDEPLNRACDVQIDEIKPCLSSTMDLVLKDDISLLARSIETDEIAGCIKNSIWHRESSDHDYGQDSERSGCEMNSDRKNVLAFGEMLNDIHNAFWELCPPGHETVVHCEIVSVGKNHQRQGIASTFMNWSEQSELLKSLNATGVVAEASSIANQTLLSRRGYTTLATTLLSTIIDPDTGKQLLVCDDGTDRVKLMFKEFIKPNL